MKNNWSIILTLKFVIVCFLYKQYVVNTIYLDKRREFNTKN